MTRLEQPYLCVELLLANEGRTGNPCRGPANNGATAAEFEAIFGWQGGGMASLYTRADAWLRELWRSWMERPMNTLFPNHLDWCGSQSEKINDFTYLDLQGWCGREDSNLHGSPH